MSLFDDCEDLETSVAGLLERAIIMLADAAADLRPEAPDHASKIDEFITRATDWIAHHEIR